jgi:pyruvate,water dikinase
VHDLDDAFEATPDELRALLGGGGPAPDVLARRSAERRQMDQLTPPLMVGEPVPAEPLELPPATKRLAAMRDAWWGGGVPRSEAGRAAATVGSDVVRGRALVVVRDPVEAIHRAEPGDVLVAPATHAAYNVLFPLVAAVAVQEGGAMSHPAILARELGVTAVIGLPGLLDRVRDGDQVEVDPVAGTITVLDQATPELSR